MVSLLQAKLVENSVWNQGPVQQVSQNSTGHCRISCECPEEAYVAHVSEWSVQGLVWG